MLVLGIETSCDDTSVALIQGADYSITEYVDYKAGERPAPKLLGLKHFSQEELLKKWGGIVPEIAARNHLLKLTPLLKELFKEHDLKAEQVDLIGVTTCPGLLGPLFTGLNAAKTMSLLYRTPIVPVNHLFAHLEAIHLTKQVPYPYLGLIVSGGHSLFVHVKSPVDFEVLGGTIDDAAGEAFDKGGKLMGLGYPAGKQIDELASHGDPNFYQFPIGLATSKDTRLSYSGLKTSLRQFLENHPDFDREKNLNNLCAAYQSAIVQALKLKLGFAHKQHPQCPIVVGGGVACNSELRKILTHHFPQVYFVEPKYCTDNGAMIANLALRSHAQLKVPWPQCLGLDARGRYIEKQKFVKGQVKSITKKSQN